MTENTYTEEEAALSDFLFSVYDHGNQPNALKEARAILKFLGHEEEPGEKILLDLRPLHNVYPEDRNFIARLNRLADRVEMGMRCRIKIGRDAEIENGRFYFQIACYRMDVITKKMGLGYGGKAYLSPHMTDSELFQIMFGLYKGYWEHEARENFEIDGVRPFGPHISTEALISVARKVDVRSAKHVEDRDAR